MATTQQQNFPADSVTLTATGLASLGTSSTFVAGYALDAVSNRSNLDLDHQLSALITVGTTPTINTQIQLWILAARSFASGTPAYPAPFSSSYTGSAGAFTANSAGVLQSVGKLLWTGNVDSTTSNRVYELTCGSIASLFGFMPSDWFAFVTHNTGVALNATGGNFTVTYTRVRATST